MFRNEGRSELGRKKKQISSGKGLTENLPTWMCRIYTGTLARPHPFFRDPPGGVGRSNDGD